MNQHVESPEAGADLLATVAGRRFSTIMADPPWRCQNSTGKVAPDRGAPSHQSRGARVPDENASGDDHPHFVRDYRNLVAALTEAHGADEAGRQMVGVEFDAVGKLMSALMKHLGLKDGDFLMDVGCGSGRLAIPLGANGPEIQYHGSDIVPELLDYARARTPSRFRFTLVEGLSIPEEDGTADFVTFFSVFTHLMLHEIFIYLQDAHRVVKPGGRVVFSFYDPSNPVHWDMFIRTVSATKARMVDHLNAFIEERSFLTLAERLGMEVEHVFTDGTPFIPLDEPVEFTTGHVARDKWLIGQSVIVLRKPL